MAGCFSILTAAQAAAPLNDPAACRKAFSGVTGVYVLYCIVTGNYYIGSSKTDVWLRVSDYTQSWYQSSRSTHPIVRAIVKYGVGSFLVLLLDTGPADTVRKLEQAAIDRYAPAYNQLKHVDNSLGFKHTEATKRLLSELKTGHVRTAASKLKQAETITGPGNHRYGVKLTPEQKERLRQVALALTTSLKPCDAIIVEHTATSTKTEYRSVRKAAEHEPYTRPVLTAALKGTASIPGVLVYYAPKPHALSLFN